MEAKQYGNVARACARLHIPPHAVIMKLIKPTLLAIFPKSLKGVLVKGAVNVFSHPLHERTGCLRHQGALKL